MPHSPLVTVQYASSGWQAKFTAAMLARNFIRVQIKGSSAAQVRGIVEDFTVVKVPAPPLPFIPVPYPKISSTSFLAMVPALLGVVVQALTFHGYTTMTAGYDAKGSGSSDDVLTLELR